MLDIRAECMGALKVRRPVSGIYALLAIVATISTPPGQVSADEKPPRIAWLFPAGVQRGKTVEVTVGGTELAGATAIRVTGRGVEGKVLAAPNDKIETLKLSIINSADAEPGQRDLCIQTSAGVSNWFHFFVGQLPEVNEIEPNDDLAKAQPLPPLPVLVNGQINPQAGQLADRDSFRFEAKAGQTLVFTVDARAIVPYMSDAVPGWLQAVLTLYDANGKALAYADGFRFKQDTVLIYKVPADGQYVIEVRDSLYRGREDFVYRLSIGELPYITDIYPLGGKRGTIVPVHLHGVNLEQTAINVKVPQDGPRILWLDTTGHGLASNHVKFEAGELEETTEVEPNDTPQQANRVNVGSVVNGRIGKPGDMDYYAFKAAAQQKLVIEVHARRLDSPLDSVITIFDGKGKLLAENDDIQDDDQPPITHQADSRLEFTAPAEGDYFLRVRDAQHKGGPEYAYRLSIAAERPDFELQVVSDNPSSLAPGDTAVATVAAIRRDGYTGEIHLALSDAPRGFTMRGGLLGDSRLWYQPREAQVTLTAPADAPVGMLTPVIVGTARIGDKEVVRHAVPVTAVKQAFSINHRVPIPCLVMTIAAKQPEFMLATDLATDKVLEVPPGGELKIPITAVRGKNATAAIAVAPSNPVSDGGVSITSGRIEPGKSACIVTLSVNKTPWDGKLHCVIFTGTMDTGKEKVVRHAPAILVKVVKPAPTAK